MKNSNLMDRVESASPVLPNAFQDLTETAEGRALADRIVGTSACRGCR